MDGIKELIYKTESSRRCGKQTYGDQEKGEEGQTERQALTGTHHTYIQCN